MNRRTSILAAGALVAAALTAVYAGSASESPLWAGNSAGSIARAGDSAGSIESPLGLDARASRGSNGAGGFISLTQ